MRTHSLGSTTEYVDPTWSGEGFAEPEQKRLWGLLPRALQTIAIAEISAGNLPSGILENRDRNIVVLSFPGGPLVSPEFGTDLRRHTEHENKGSNRFINYIFHFPYWLDKKIT